jgi:hypothetical protein
MRIQILWRNFILESGRLPRGKKFPGPKNEILIRNKEEEEEANLANFFVCVFQWIILKMLWIGSSGICLSMNYSMLNEVKQYKK